MESTIHDIGRPKIRSSRPTPPQEEGRMQKGGEVETWEKDEPRGGDRDGVPEEEGK